MNTVVLWTLVIFAESLGNNTLTSNNIPGFTNREACQEAAREMRNENQTLRTSRGNRIGENGVDIKALICLPVR